MMTREEASVQIEGLKKYCEDMADSDESGSYVFDLDVQALDLALSTLRPVSRERVEKVFGGKWEEETYTTVSGRGRVIHSKKYTCSACGKSNGRAKTNFCHHCGASQTDEAVEIRLKELEALHGEKESD